MTPLSCAPTMSPSFLILGLMVLFVIAFTWGVNHERERVARRDARRTRWSK